MFQVKSRLHAIVAFFQKIFFHILIPVFTIALIKCSAHLFLTFYLLFFFRKVTFSFLSTCYLLDKLKQLNHRSYEALKVFLFCICNKKHSKRYDFVYQLFDTSFC